MVSQASLGLLSSTRTSDGSHIVALEGSLPQLEPRTLNLTTSAPGAGPLRRFSSRGNMRRHGLLDRTLVCSIALISILSLLPVAFDSATTIQRTAPPTATTLQRTGAAAAAAIEGAEQSLLAGDGPAGGTPMDCTSSMSGSASCSSQNAPPAAPASPNGGPTSPFVSFATPAARYGAASSYVMFPGGVSWGGTLLFGGASSSPAPRFDNPAGPPFPPDTVFGDTWMLETQPTTSTGWVNLTGSSCGSANVPCPAPRYDAAMAYEQTNNYVLMFGGCQLPENFTEATPGCEWGSLLGDTWAWIPAPVGSGNAPAGTWSQVWLNGVQCGGPSQNACASGLSPSPRFGEGLADSYPWNESIYMFGGCARVGTYSGSCALGDTWSFTLGSITFCPANCPVGGGGYVVNGSWSQVPIRGSDCGGPLPGNGIPDPCPSGSAPVPRWGLGFGNLGLGFDGVLFGGCGSSVSANSGCGSSYLYGDTWKFDGAWSQLALFPVGQNLVVCGGPGQRSCGSYSPSPRYYPGFASISSGDACLFGGTSGIASGSQVATADLWVMSYYTSTGAWSWGSIFNPVPPAYGNWTPRFDPVLTASDECWSPYLFGGTAPSGGSLGDTEFIPNRNTQVNSGYTLWPPTVPPPRYGVSMTYWSDLTVIVLFGGCGANCPSGDLWLYGTCSAIVSSSSYDCSPALSSQPIWYQCYL